jgi:competence protein ComGC
MIKKGFTLLEMVIVLAIIALIYLLTIPNIQKVIKIMNDKGCVAQLKVIDTAIIEYKMEFDEEAETIDDLVNAELLTDEQAICQDNTQIVIEDGQATLQ